MTIKEYKTVVKKFSFLEFHANINAAYIGDEIVVVPVMYHSHDTPDTVETVEVYNKVLTEDDDDEFVTDPYVYEIAETPEELYEALLKLVEPYNTWKKSQRLALIEEL